MKKKDIIGKIQEVETRWIAFIEKMEERLNELCEASTSELRELFQSDPDDYKRTYHRLLSGIQGQIRSMEAKASDVYDKNVHNVFESLEDDVDDIGDEELSDFLSNADEKCCDLLEKFESLADEWNDKLALIGEEDLESRYKAILDEYEQIKNKFTCKQCSSIIPIPKIFFIATHITCPACQTQNTFMPSSQTAQLEFVGRALAEQRTKYLLDEHHAAEEKERELYNQQHNLELSIIHEEDKTRKAGVKAQIEALEEERREVERNSPKLYQKYMRAMFDEWNKIVPDLAEQNEKVYQSWLKGMEKSNIIE